MKIFLNQNTNVQNVPVLSSVPANGTGQVVTGKLLLKSPPVGEMWRLCEQQDSCSKEFVEKLQKASSIYQEKQESNNSHHLCIHIISSYNPTTKWIPPSTVRVHGFLWNDDILEELKHETWKLKLQMSLTRTNNSSLKYLGMFNAELPLISNEPLGEVHSEHEACIGVGRDCFCENTNVPYDGKVFSCSLSPGMSIGAIVNVVLKRDYSKASLSKNFWICQQILESGIHADAVITASNGTEFKCNKAFLAAHSTVLAAMLHTNTDMKESKTGRVDIVDMSEDAIRAFLGYLYTCSVMVPLTDSKIALELLKAGHKYDIPHLEEEMKNIFRNKSVCWWDAETALRLFLFVRDLEDCEEVKQKSVKVLKVYELQKYELNCFREIQGNVGVKVLQGYDPGESCSCCGRCF